MSFISSLRNTKHSFHKQFQHFSLIFSLPSTVRLIHFAHSPFFALHFFLLLSLMLVCWCGVSGSGWLYFAVLAYDYYFLSIFILFLSQAVNLKLNSFLLLLLVLLILLLRFLLCKNEAREFCNVAYSKMEKNVCTLFSLVNDSALRNETKAEKKSSK